jgi:hypothetical protein
MASSALLSQIQAGRALKKAVTNDRSAPKVEGSSKPGGGALGGGGIGGIGAALANGSTGRSALGSGGDDTSSTNASAGGPPQLGGLFAGGMPKLKPPSQATTGKLTLLSI